MPVYEYVAIDAAGKSRKGVIDADDARMARQKLRAGGLFPSLINEARSEQPAVQARRPGLAGRAGRAGRIARKDAPGRRSRLFSMSLGLKRVKRSELAATTRQMSTLLSAGLPLEQVLTAILAQIKGTALYTVLAQVRERVKEGASLSSALAQHPGVFGTTYATMVQAGEQSGALELVMARLADFAEQEMELRRKIWSAITYPLLMLFVGLGIVFFLMVYVVPRITEIFVDLQRALPLPTTILIAVSTAFRDWWFLAPLAGLGAWFGLSRYARKPQGRRRLHSWRLRMPVVGRLTHAIAIARFSRTFGTLLANGVTLLISLDIVRSVVSNVILQDAVDSVSKEVSEGAGLAEAMSRHDVFPPTMIQMLSAGEQSGELHSMLFKVAELYENEISTRLAIMTSLLEPVMILALGGIVGFVVLAVLLPIFEMSSLVR
ncbi:type II secretion system inner membrane protein GspF [Desulfocurvibacter africanus]|uniref:General secretion pathway protein F n=1 Tax=Desulfocurvibacter africanus subsp. africanus str. Walvis Bay TaxID=690850 RepID=F3YYD0_DESAF|nr:type II secretion system inner membrane protein GspF [Desulfocurvibacter africanus]EGJ49574.1 general secretion pathway protein F [Desulfocurvibacter africanus subsp. africanus str. Walvis Bay]